MEQEEQGEQGEQAEQHRELHQEEHREEDDPDFTLRAVRGLAEVGEDFNLAGAVARLPRLGGPVVEVDLVAGLACRAGHTQPKR